MNIYDDSSPEETPNPERNRTPRPGKGRKLQRWSREELEKAFANRHPLIRELKGRFAGFNVRTDKNGRIHVREPQTRQSP